MLEACSIRDKENILFYLGTVIEIFFISFIKHMSSLLSIAVLKIIMADTVCYKNISDLTIHFTCRI
jgi:hypothetical protein